MINLKEITEDNLVPILKLEVEEDQKDQVASNAVSIAQGHYRQTAWFRGIYKNDTPVGFVMLDIKPVENECYLWRFMIAKEYQGLGYGKIALMRTIDYVKSLNHFDKILSSYVPKEKNGADGFYLNFGFTVTGKLEDSTEIGIEYSLNS